MRLSRPWAIGLAVYAALLASSHLVRAVLGVDRPTAPGAEQAVATIPEHDAEGRPTGRSIGVAYRAWGDAGDPRPPILLLHGSPGEGSNFEALGPLLARDGRRVIAPDLPGFGASEPSPASVAPRAHARDMLGLLDALGAPRAHGLGWSMGGAVALRMAGAAPERLASVTMLGSVGAQESEGSGSFAFERARYGLGWAVFVPLAEAVPDFGLLGPRGMRRNWIANFLEADLRPMAEIMRALRVPVLILHGRHDILAPWHGAEDHHALMPATSRLVMLDANHFLPFMQAEETASIVGGFVARHDAPGVAPETGVDRRSVSPPLPMGDAGERLRDAFVRWPWWAHAVVALVAAALAPGWATLGAGMLRSIMWVDLGVVLVGVLAGRMLRERPGGARAALGVAARTLGGLALAALVCGPVALRVYAALDGGLAGLIAGVLAGGLAFAVLRRVWSRAGRRTLRLLPARLAHHEWWPSWMFYLPLWPWLVWLALRHRCATAFTCANPGIEHGGGFIDESKAEIMSGFARARTGQEDIVLPWALLPAGGDADARLRRATDLLAARPDLGGYPIIAKPDRGQNGFGVTLCRSEADLRRALERMPVDLILQRFHPGPEEFAVLWVREVDARGEGLERGRIFSVTRKSLQYTVGDGRRSLRALIRGDRRLRMQEHIFEARFGARGMRRVPARGERVTLVHTGNHCQGALFRDAGHLVTPALEAAMDRAMLAFRGAGGGGLDIARLDLRCAGDEDLRAGRLGGVVELNGTTAESVNFYDPDHGLRWAYGLLLRQWARAYALGAWRRRGGARATGLLGLVRMVLRHRRRRRGSAVAS